MGENRRAVVVGCDGSWQSDVAVEAAAREAHLRGSPLLVLSVPTDRELFADTLSAVMARETEALALALARAEHGQDRALAYDERLEVRILAALLDSSVVKAAAAEAAMLVLGGHGLSGGRAFALGTVSGELARLCRAPILVPRLVETRQVNNPPDRRPAVVVGMGGGGTGADLLALAVQEAALRSVGVIAVRVVPPRTGTAALEQAERDTWSLVRDVAPPPGIMPVRVVVSVDEPALALDQECRPDDLLVLGTRGGGRLAGLVAGSVARRLLDRSPCDIMVVPMEPKVPSRTGLTAASTADGT